MATKICMNELCGATTTSEWKRGWTLRSGGFAILCSDCGSAYDNSVFCETFHLEDTGWRDCRICGKHIHCGCIVSRYSHEYMDFGGVGCSRCAQLLDIQSPRTVQIPGSDISNGPLMTNGMGNLHPLTIDNRIGQSTFNSTGLMQLAKTLEATESGAFFQSHIDDTNASLGQVRGENSLRPIAEVNACLSNPAMQSTGKSLFVKPDNRGKQVVTDMYETPAQPSLNFSLETSLSTPSSAVPLAGGSVEGSEQNKIPSFQQGQRTRHILPKPPKPGPSTGSESNKGTAPQARIARPPAEGRGRNQLLPRYWPRITDEELQQLSGDLNSTIVPLFEKILSASDAGRIGRLVLPKACAEAYFPPINQSEGLPIRIQDVKGNEWTFQFRFWPNNNSRMYVLEGVTPCIQNMQLQAGDTVTFSRIDPGGKLVMGFRKATNNGDAQDEQPSSMTNGGSSGETSVSGVTEKLPPNGGRVSEDLSQRNISNPEKKKTRNIGSKNKRLVMHNEEARQLRITWAEAQDMFRAPPTGEPTLDLIEDHEFEAFEEPPVFGKRTIFVTEPTGDQTQWVQCDLCSRWRRLPEHVLVEAKWQCTENVWDPSRCSCSAPDELSPNELDALVRISKDLKRRRPEDDAAEEFEPSGLDALATVAVLGDNMGDLGGPMIGATTRHPRHRPGCSCIVCIQPPSGKGKHDPECVCNVCMTVKRRFRTLMSRKKQRQLDRVTELSKGKDEGTSRTVTEMDEVNGEGLPNQSESERSHDGVQTEAGQLDLNCDPNRDDDVVGLATTGLNFTNLVAAASTPFELRLSRNLPSSVFTGAVNDNEVPSDDQCATSGDPGRENKGNGGQ